MIYLDSAATSFYRPPCVAEAVAEAISSMGNCSRGAYKEALTGARVIFETRVLLSEMFHGDGPEQVAFTANSTESLNIAIKGLIRPGDRVVTTVLEHNSVCLLYTSDAADELDGVDLGGRRIIKKKFFQAEDGIRDQPRSRGLGDVYKRQ